MKPSLPPGRGCRMSRAPFFFAALGLLLCCAVHARPNLLLITVDDMSCDSVGAFGCRVPGTTPNIDRLAAGGRRFLQAHVQVGNCYPSRNVMWSGRYPHRSGVEGFYAVRPIDYPVMTDVMKEAGYYVGIRGKVTHSTPYQPYAWDGDHTTLPDGSTAHIKDVGSYYASTRAGIEAAAAAGKPFCLNINVSDPHKPFWRPGDPHPTSRAFSADEVVVPGFLPDLPEVREELALYYSSVRRADDCVGEVLRALDESGAAGSTFVLFLSDHGMPLPFAKTQLYHHSTRTPLIVRWPGVTESGSADERHMVSAVDLLATLCDVAGVEAPAGMDGRSFAELIRGGVQEGRDTVFKEYNENSGGKRNPMRAVQTSRYLYLFNPWSDGERTMGTATNGTATWRAMKARAAGDSDIRARVAVMEHRSVEELYDLTTDPDCLRDLAGSPEHATALKHLQDELERWMRRTEDHALGAFLGREDAAVLEGYMARVEAESAARRAARRLQRQADP